jgi:hypothetical protein
MKIFKNIITCVSILIVLGCSGVIHIDNTEIPNTATELREYIAAKQAYIDGLAVELEIAKESRDTMAKSDATATGYFAKSETSRRLRSANLNIEFVTFKLTASKSSLAKAKARLESIESEEE